MTDLVEGHGAAVRIRQRKARKLRSVQSLGAATGFYLSPDHRAERANGCPFVALASDAARQGTGVKASFEDGIRQAIELLGRCMGEGPGDGDERSTRAMAALSTMVGAVVLARAVNDADFAQQFLDTAAQQVRAHAVEQSPATHRTSRGARRNRGKKANAAEPAIGSASDDMT